MDFLLPFIFGAIVGWLIKWVYDSINAPMVRADGPAQQTLAGEIAMAETRIKALAAELGDAKKAASAARAEKDRLEKIRGIGPVFAQRLNEAGVKTFSDLATISPERVQAIISPQDWQAIDPPAWIPEARELVKLAEVNGAAGL